MNSAIKEDFGYNMSYGQKWLKAYFQLNYIFFFVIDLNFSAFCKMYTVYRRYRGLLQNIGNYEFLLNVIN